MPTHPDVYHGPSKAWLFADQQVLLTLRDAGARYAARGNPWRPGAQRLAGRGRTEATQRALNRAHKLVAVCQTPACSSLVELLTAWRQARAAGRDHLRPGDGCASLTCTRWYRAGKFKKRQVARAAGVLNGQLSLIRWPEAQAGPRAAMPEATLINSAAARRAAQHAMQHTRMRPPRIDAEQKWTAGIRDVEVNDLTAHFVASEALESWLT
jgi:hypothetical protein